MLLTFSVVFLMACNSHNQMVAVVTIGFVKDAKHHIDVQGFNVYHKNRLIKVFLVLNFIISKFVAFSMKYSLLDFLFEQ